MIQAINTIKSIMTIWNSSMGWILSADDKGYDEAFYSADSDYEKYSKHMSIYRQ